ncbi:thrombopoietin receptor [Mugil cephalus]|uniref:thrombopoietin receptor n=1 Tax=Mugil cephalus TaxID=48193 RepID=UPI001FB68DC5|nr:thrombopoietin receptor [Mugil cephalus]
MNMFCRLEILFISVWIQVVFVPGIHCNHLSNEDVLILKDEPNPKCFSRTEKDFTCFFETSDNGTYDLSYTVDQMFTNISCNTSVRAMEEGTFLHICYFPPPHVWMFVSTIVKVVERSNNSNFFERTFCVEDSVLLDPPFNVSLQLGDQIGQLKVSWQAKPTTFNEDIMHKIRFSSRGLGERIKEANNPEDSILDSLTPGEEVEVQVAVRKASGEGHWSSWSRPVRAVVPQSAEDISLTCFTSDLYIFTCHWNGSRYGLDDEYKLFHRMSRSDSPGWTEWTECVAGENSSDLCHFVGEPSRRVTVMLCSSPILAKRSFITKEFTFNDSIKTHPPGHLKGVLRDQKLYLTWDAPLPSLSAHMHYEVDYQISGGDRWMMMKSSETEASIEIQTDGQYSVKVRAKPSGVKYSGSWSDWSDVLTGHNLGKLLMWRILVCILILILITAIALISLFYKHHRMLKQYFWPPVPDLGKVLQGFLMDINEQKWEPVIAKPCTEETTSSVVEIMSEADVSGLEKIDEFAEFLSPEGSLSSEEQVDGSPGVDVFPDYVTLKDTLNLCPEWNNYVYARVGEKVDTGVKDVILQTCPCPHTDGPVCGPDCSDTDFLNHSYLPLAELADKLNCDVTATQGPGNLYTNFPYT